MKYLITGGSGFLGSHLTKYLLNEGHVVHVIDNFCTGSTENITPHLDNPRFFLFTQNITDPIPEYNYNYIFNLACPASPIHYQRLPTETLNTCFNGTLNVLKYCHTHGISMFHASTSEIYGDPLEHPQKETYYGNVNTFGPRSCYDEGKRVAESLCYEWGKKGVYVHIGRIFNTYGPNMCINDGRVISEFVVNALKGKDLIINGNGSATRSFCYVDDLIDVIIKFSKSNKCSQPINIGNPEELTLKDLAEKILSKISTNSKIIYSHPLVNDPVSRQPDISMAQNYFKWNPKINLDSGLDKTISYFKEAISG
jgi:UDP-glucuronate decarboxylase